MLVASPRQEVKNLLHASLRALKHAIEPERTPEERQGKAWEAERLANEAIGLAQDWRNHLGIVSGLVVQARIERLFYGDYAQAKLTIDRALFWYRKHVRSHL